MDKTFGLVKKEEKRQRETLNLIPSENYASKDVKKALSSAFLNKYAEGYPGKRYYQGNKYVDEVENLAVKRAKRLFSTPHANVQPYSGSPANAAVLFALCEGGDKVCGMKLSAGGHLTHGHPTITFSGKYFKPVQYGVNENGHLDYKKIERLIKKEKPKVIFAGTTAYPFKIDFERFAKMADSIGAYLVADISHIAGLVVAGLHQSPSSFAHVITTTTHKTLRGPRGAVVMVTDKGVRKDKDLPQKIDKAVFPGLQGGPHINTIAAIAVALKEAQEESFKTYAKQIIANARSLQKALVKNGIKTYGTQNHLMLLDFSDFGGGAQMAIALEGGGIVVNKNLIPNDKLTPRFPSGVRMGTPAITSRGLKEKNMQIIADWVSRVYEEVKNKNLPEDDREKFIISFEKWIYKNKEISKIKNEVRAFLTEYPIK